MGARGSAVTWDKQQPEPPRVWVRGRDWPVCHTAIFTGFSVVVSIVLRPLLLLLVTEWREQASKGSWTVFSKAAW